MSNTTHTVEIQQIRLEQLLQAEAENQELREALRDLVEEVEMAESVGICLPDRVPSLRAIGLMAAGPLPAALAPPEEPKLHDPWDFRCNRRVHGERWRDGARCPVCRAAPPEEPKPQQKEQE